MALKPRNSNVFISNRKLFDWSLLFLWVLIITSLSLLPNHKVAVGFFNFNQADKIFHFIFYFGFAILLFRLLYNTTMKIGNSLLIIAAVIPIVYSGIIELAQEYLVASRNAEFFDFAVNIAGAVAAIIFYRFILRVEFNRFYTKELS
ncbi:putative integral membrane protein [Salinivirga cyanobacteriivorans]|uniref:Putative integral membrane protein n=1 Tax=Salinivirga cyanobacteriivorans TaxID=1307839 RepID=A0A0S2I155_9BACT|nr:VanZ family protein [Salinivirga cyanobacteriivorans]ALO16049.1 putative integral membrane protein [Salinivirga cyanobacteriivorans]